VISDRRRRDAASFLAQGTQRGGRKLVLGPPSPGLQVIPRAPVERLRRCEVASVHCYLCGSGRTVGPIWLSSIDAGGSR
jgi:hypothetical protein